MRREQRGRPARVAARVALRPAAAPPCPACCGVRPPAAWPHLCGDDQGEVAEEVGVGVHQGAWALLDVAPRHAFVQLLQALCQAWGGVGWVYGGGAGRVCAVSVSSCAVWPASKTLRINENVAESGLIAGGVPMWPCTQGTRAASSTERCRGFAAQNSAGPLQRVAQGPTGRWSGEPSPRSARLLRGGATSCRALGASAAPRPPRMQHEGSPRHRPLRQNTVTAWTTMRRAVTQIHCIPSIATSPDIGTTFPLTSSHLCA